MARESDKSSWERVAENDRARTSTEQFRRERHMAPIRAMLIGTFSLLDVAIFWAMKWPPGICAGLLIAGSLLIVSIHPSSKKAGSVKILPCDPKRQPKVTWKLRG